MRVSETKFVELLRHEAGRHAKGLARSSGLRRGIGDDCAVIACSRQKDILITTDLFLEAVHFRREWQLPRSVGHKILARGLSDIAAMGGTPRYVFLSLGLPRGLQARWMNAFWQGFFALATAAKVVLAGGDTGASRNGFVADIVVVGEVPRRQSILRSGARPGDEIWVTGRLGLAATGLRILEGRRASENKKNGHAEALQAFCYPQPRLRAGKFVRERKLASAMIDLSDGLSLDLSRLCQESGVGARIVERWIPQTGSLTAVIPASPHDALHGGEDLELLFTVPPAKSGKLPRSISGVKLTRIGHIIASRSPGEKLLLVRGGKEQILPVLGFQHF